jgi:very-short-patch-repair endonuclease
MLFFPKPVRKKKAPKPLKRSRKPIAAKAVFKAHGDNVFKTYRRRYTDGQVMAKAREYQLERKRDMPAAQIVFNVMLDDLRVLYESEAIMLNGDRFILIDAYVKSAKLASEIDGSTHDLQTRYDVGRDAWLLRTYGVHTVRFTNDQVFRRLWEVRERVINELSK